MNPTDRPRSAAVIALASMCILVAGSGCYFLAEILTGVARGTAQVIGAIAGFVFASLPIVVAWGAWFRRTLSWIRSLCVIAIVFAAGELMAITERVSIGHTGHPIRFFEGGSSRTALIFKSVELFLVILAIIAHHLFAGWLIKGLKLEADRSVADRLWSMKMSLTIVGLFIFTDGSKIVELLITQALQSWQQLEAIDWLVHLGPLLLAIAVYKIGMAVAARRLERSAPSVAGVDTLAMTPGAPI